MANRRVWILLAVLAVLAIANVWVQFSGGGSGVAALFENSGGDAADLPPDVRRKADALEQLPRLSFRNNDVRPEAEPTAGRNPFLFGVDRRKQEADRRRMAELEQTRKQMEAARAAREEEKTAEPEVETFDGKVVGLMRKHGGGDAMVSVWFDNEIRVVRQGETLGGRFRVIAIEDARVRLLALRSNREIVIDLEDSP